MKILLATGHPELDNQLKILLAQNSLEIVGDCYSRTVLVDVAKELKADTVIISGLLEGQITLSELIKNLRGIGLRVVVLPGSLDMDDTKELVIELVPYGVYDFVYDELTPEDILNRLKNPATLNDVPSELAKAAMDNQKLSQEVEAHAEMVVAAVEKRREDKPKGLKFNILNTIINRNDSVENKNVQAVSEVPELKIEEIPEQRIVKRPARYRSGQPAVVLGFGSKNLTDWFNTTFSNLVDIVGAATSPDEFQKAVHEKRPDLVVLMRIGPMGGLPEADALAEWATEHVPAVLFIAGELDENGEQMAERVKSAGGYVLSCPHGETINGDELVVLVQYIVRELTFVKVEQQPDAEERRRQPSINLEALKKGAIQLTSILKQGADKPDKSPGLLTRLKSQLEEGLSLEESAPVEMLANNVKNPTAIVAGGAFAVVSPWRPGLAGRIAAAAAKMFSEGGEEVAVIGASGYSTAAVWLDITDEELMMSDWRVPGSQAPVVKDNIKIWAVDPTKSLHMNIDGNLWVQLKEVRKTAAYTVIDFAGDFELAQKVAFQGRSVVLVIIPGGDPVEQRTALLWLNRFMEGKNNIIAGIDLRGVPPTTLQDFKPKLVIRNSPVDAFKMALCKNLDEFIWK